MPATAEDRATFDRIWTRVHALCEHGQSEGPALATTLEEHPEWYPAYARCVAGGTARAVSPPVAKRAPTPLADLFAHGLRLHAREQVATGLAPTEMAAFDAFFTAHPTAYNEYRDLCRRRAAGAR